MPWITEQPLAHPRSALAAATCGAPASNSRIYAIGGLDTGTHVVATAAAYDTRVGGGWSPIAPMHSGRGGLAAASETGRLHALGGATDAGVGVAAHEIYHPAQDKWSPAKSMPTARYGLAAVTGPDGLIYALGGIAAITGPLLAVVEAYDPTKDTWTPKTSMPTPRALLAAVTGQDGLIYAIGGINTAGTPLSTVEAYDPSADKWTFKKSLPAAKLNLAAAVEPQGVIYAIGGYDATVYSYDPAHPGWAPQAPLPTVRASLAAATGPDGLIYAIGGQTVSAGQWQIVGTVEAYTEPPPDNACLDLVAGLEQRLADGGPKVRVQEYAGFTKELATCYQQRQLTQQQYDHALWTLKEINKSPQTPPRP